MGMSQALVMIWVVTMASGNFVNFKYGFEYQYNMNSKADVKTMGEFHVSGKVGFTNVEDRDDGQEIYVRIYSYNMRSSHTSAPVNPNLDFSKWFSFVIMGSGEILSVYHPPDDDDHAVALKKAVASLFACRLHHHKEKHVERTDDGWRYDVTETGHEGRHRASYTVKENSEGHVFTKSRHPDDHPVKYSTSQYTKTLYYSKSLGNIHSIHINETFRPLHKVPKGYDPFENSRPIKPVNDFTNIDYPEMSALGCGKLEFLTRHKVAAIPTKPSDSVRRASIIIKNLETKKTDVDVPVYLDYVRGNLTCMRREPDTGSKRQSDCFWEIVSLLRALPDDQITRLAQRYLQPKLRLIRTLKDRNHIMDALAVLKTEYSQQLMFDNVLNITKPDLFLVQRFMVHVTSMKIPPIECIISWMEDLCFEKEIPSDIGVRQTTHRVLLTLGAVARKMWQDGRRERAAGIITRVEKWLGIHDPWHYKQKRSIMTLNEARNDDHWKVVLVETLGNAGLDQSLKYIVSHVNCTNSHWVKRAGIHALRKYHHEGAAYLMLKTALYDEDEKVRYEALLQYQSHPKAAMLAPMYKERGVLNGSVFYDDPYKFGMHNINLQGRHKRDIFDDILNSALEFHLVAPGVNWKKMLGSTEIGASLGLTMNNGLDFKLSLLNSYAKLYVHDEAFARVHLGFMNTNIELFLAKICFKYQASYNLNLIKDYVRSMQKIVRLFDSIKNNAVGGIGEAIKLFKDIIAGKFTIGDMIKNFVQSLEELPQKVAGVGKKAVDAMKVLGEIDDKQLPPFITPVRKLVQKVIALYKDTKSSVLSFFNNLMETVTIIIPRSGENLYKCIKAIIDSFKTFNKDPKAALSTIAGNVLTIGFEVKNLIDAINKTKNAFKSLAEEPPDWSKLGGQIGEITDIALGIRAKLEREGKKWTQALVADDRDPVMKFTNGKSSMADHRREVVKLVKEVVDDVLSPLGVLANLGGGFFKIFQQVYTTVQSIKTAYNDLKEGYSTARTLIDQIFGPKTHSNFTNIIRDASGDCPKSGSFPASFGNNRQDYPSEGIDLTISAGVKVVAPFAGYIRRSDRDNEVIIVPNSGSLKKTQIILTNVKADAFVPSDDSDIQVTAGQRIGVAAKSPCSDNHIHFALKRERGFVDPTMYLSPKLPDKPKFVKECSDYKIVFLDEVIATGWGTGEDNDTEEDTSPERTGQKITNPPTIDPAADPLDKLQKPGDEASPLQKAKKEKNPKLEEQIEKTQDGALKTLFKKAGAFFKKFSIRNIKLGSIMDLLEALGLDESQEKLAATIKTFKAMIDNKPCFNPYQMTDDELRVELSERGLQVEGTREKMIDVLTTPSNSCPLSKIAMPNHIFCTFDEKCLGVECCAYFKLFMFRKTYKLFARLDPCTFEFSVGAGPFNRTFGIADGIADIMGGFDKKIRTGLKLDLVGKVELVVNVKLEKDEKAALVSLGAGFCSLDDIDNCASFLYLLEDAPTPLPICNADGSVTWPEIDYRSILSKENIKKRIEGKWKSLVKTGLGQLMGLIPCISANAPGKTAPCPRPETLTNDLLKQALRVRGLDVMGNKQQLAARLRDAHTKCTVLGKTFRLPSLPDAISKFAYLEIGADCLSVEACIDVKLPGVGFHKPVLAFVELDPCKFIFTVTFETCTKDFILLGYDWGKEETLPLDGVDIKYKIDRDEVEKVFKVGLGMKIGLGEATPFMDSWLIEDLKVPIPVCNDNFSLPGGGSFKDLASRMGGALNQQAVDVLFKFLGLDTVFLAGRCSVPVPPQDCPWSLPAFKKFLPSSFQDKVTCQLTDNCFGIHCCVDFTFKIPIFKSPVVKSVPFYIKFNPCDFEIDAGFGTYHHKEKLLTYDWGKVNELKIGKGNPAPVVIKYSISRYLQGFLLDLSVFTCIPVDGDKFCFPPKGLQLLQQERVPACDARSLVNFTRRGFSMSNWLNKLELDINLNSLAKAAAKMLLDKFGISEYLLDKRCDVTRTPYSPSVDGWNNECDRSIFKLPTLPKGLYCHLADTCTKISCCFNVAFLDMSFHASMDVNMCDYTITASIEKMTTTLHILGADVNLSKGVRNIVDISNVFLLTFDLKVKDKVIYMDIEVGVCFEEDKCLAQLPVMKGTQIPQLICDLDATWNLKNFKISDWAKARGLDLTRGLTQAGLDLLLDQLGIRDMMQEPPCSRTSLKYQPADEGNWKNDCNMSLSLPSISLPANCHLNDKCLAVDCCLTSDVLALTLHAAMNIDLCNYVIEGALEKFSFRFNILQYDWGTYHEITFDDVPILKLRFRLDRLASQEVLVVDLSVSLCLEANDCDLDLEVLKQAHLPMPGCGRLQGFKFPDFSLTNWLLEKGGEISVQLSSLLMKELGLTEFLLDTQCQDYRQPYVGAKLGWTNACPEDLTLPPLSSGLSCHLMESCTGVSCCLKVSQIKRNFNAFLSVDACNYHISMGIEKLSYTQTLVDYQWGKTEEIDLGGIFRLEFRIEDLSGQKKLLIDLSLKVCLTADSECTLTLPVLKDALIPKPICDWEATRQLQDFSLREFVSAQGGQLTDVLSDSLVAKLLEVLGVSEYLINDQCKLQPRGPGGWTSACPIQVPLPDLPNSISCRLPAHCTGVICCIDVPLIRRQIQFKVDLDMCRMSLTLAIEKFQFTKMIFKYQWGERDSFTLKGIFRVDFVIDNLEGEKQLLVSLNISACFEAGQNCLVNLPVLKEARFPNPACQWNSTLSLRGFSLSSWFENLKLDPRIELSKLLRLKLAESLGISQYLHDPMCDRHTGVYKPDSHGWNNACPSPLTLPSLPDGLSCHVPDYCTGIDCCVSVHSLGWSFNFKILLDVPNNVLTIGIEKLVFQVSLFDYKWGQWDFFNLNGVLKLSFKLDDFELAWKYVLSVKLSVCFEAGQSCAIDFPVLPDLTFPKLVWNWKKPFLSANGKTTQSDFSLKKWFTGLNLTPMKQLVGLPLSKLLDQLGLTDFLKDPKCSPTDPPYAGAVAGWKKDCPASLNLPSLPDPITCHLSDPCGTVECCMYLELIGRSISVKVGISPCTFMLTVGIEKLVFTRALTTYTWGDVEHFSLKGLIHVTFLIDDLYGEKAFLISVNASVCLEKDSCLLSFPVLTNVRLPKPICDWESTAALKDFSLKDFQLRTETVGSVRLPTAIVAKLFEKLEIAGYLIFPQCDRNSVLYKPATNGWKNDCPFMGVGNYMQTLSDNMACHVTDQCTAINCCLYVDFLSRSFNFLLAVDMCSYQLIIGVENLQHREMLFDYQWGSDRHFFVKGVLRIDYTIARVSWEKKLEVTVNISVCLDKTSCIFSNQLLDRARIPQPFCDWSARLAAVDFHLPTWMSGKGLSSAVTSLTDTLISQLLDDIGVSQYLLPSPCGHLSTIYSPANIKNWNNECSRLTVPRLPDSVRCHLSSNCSHVDCCVNVPLVKRNIQLTFDLDVCCLLMTFKLEKLQFKLSLLEYNWGNSGYFILGTMIRIVYRIEHIPASQKLVIDLALKICFEDDSCVADISILSGAQISYSPCQTDVKVPFQGVSLDFWKPSRCTLPPSDCSASLPAVVSDICQLTDNCSGVTCCLEIRLNYLGVYHLTVGIVVDHCNDQLIYHVENKQWTKKLSSMAFDTNHTESVGSAITLSYIINISPSLYTISLHLKVCATVGQDLSNDCFYYIILDKVTFLKSPECSTGTRRKKRSVLDLLASGDPKKILSEAMKQGMSNNQIKDLLERLKKQDHEKILKNMNIPAAPGPAVNTKSTFKEMGMNNPGTILYSGETGGGNFVVGMEGGGTIMKVLGVVTDIIGRQDESYTVGKGLTGRGLQLLGAKLANMSIGEMIAMFDAKNIDPELAFKLTMELKDLAYTLYSEIVDAIIGEGGDAFKSFDLTLKGDFSVPRQNLDFFSYTQDFFVGGFIHVQFSFGAGCSYGMKVEVGAKIMGLKAFGLVTPYANVNVWGELGVGFILYAKLRLDGYIMTVAFPTRAEIGFAKFPMDLRLIMDMEIIPLQLTLKGLVTLEVNLIFTTFSKTLFSKVIWGYSTPTITKRLIDTGKKEEDSSPPEFEPYVDENRHARGAHVTHSCQVSQLADRDYTEPALEIAVSAKDDVSQVEIFVDAGTKPGLSDVLNKVRLGGPSSIMTQKLSKRGIPIYFTVYGENSAGTRSSVTCHINTYDVTLPGGRLNSDFLSTSNPAELRASVVVYEDSEIIKSSIGVGLGRSIYGDEVIAYSGIDLKSRDNGNYDPSSDHSGHIALTHFTGGKEGRLLGPVFSQFKGIKHAGACVKECLKYSHTKCLSLNYDYGDEGHCELLDAIEGHDHKIAISGQYVHFERLGVGLAHEFIYEDLTLRHQAMYYFNLHLINSLKFEKFIHSHGVLVDLTPPQPGPMMNASMDVLEVADCLAVVPEDRPDWQRRCKGINVHVQNHRIIHDGPGSLTLFNGDEPLNDLLYTRANRYITANWDGITDKETGILGYSWTVGREPCEELIHPHNDPHKHLLDEFEWTHTGLISPIPAPYSPLSDGKYYMTLRALNKVSYGGPLVTTICHTTPLGVDNSPPFLYEIFNITYDEDTAVIHAQYNGSDPESELKEVDLCLGHTTRDCNHLDWMRSPHDDSHVTYVYTIPGGTPVWLKLRVMNNVRLLKASVADHPIIIDITPPVAGIVYDGPIYRHDLNFTKDNDKICANWQDFYDPESGISHYEAIAQNEDGVNVSKPTSVDYKTHELCVSLDDEHLLEHGKAYSFRVMAYNAGHKQLNVSAESNGVIVDLTPPTQGQAVDGRRHNFDDVVFSTHVATVASQWKGNEDPESDLKDYELQVLRAKSMSSDFQVIKDWTTLSRETNEIEWHNFHLYHKDIVKTKVMASNNALGSVEQTTDGFVVDLTPPRLKFLGDGLQAGKDTDFQQNTDTVMANFLFIDEESGIDHFKYKVFELYQGSRHQIYPDSGDWEDLNDATSTSLSQSGLQLEKGAKYNVRVGAVNKAGAIAIYDTNGVKLDNTIPLIKWVRVGILSGEDEEEIDGHVIQSDPFGIKATWFGVDGQSGIKLYTIAVGTSPGNADILPWTDVGSDRDRYIDGLTLNVTDIDLMVPLYYVSVKATNGAGMESNITVSKPVQVVKQDKPGVVIDGADSTDRLEYMGIGVDLDNQKDSGTVTVQFGGFESHEHGVTHFDWAVGTTPGGEEVQPFMMAGLIHLEGEPNVPGNGIASSGFGQAVLPLVSGTKYYTTVRGITNDGNILESTSDGFMVDQTPPLLQFDSFGKEENESHISPEVIVFQSELDSMSSSWRAVDTESGIKKLVFSVGTYPGSEDVVDQTDVEPLVTGEGALPTGIKPATGGIPNIVTVTGENEVGLTSTVISPTLVVDVTPPVQGVVICPDFIQPLSVVECHWIGFSDEESNVEEFQLAVGSQEGLEDIIDSVSIAGHTTKYILQDVAKDASHGQTYYAKVTATNTVGMTSSSISNAIRVDTTPPSPGTVVELKSVYIINVTDAVQTEKLNSYKCDTIEDCLAIDAICQESLSSVNIAWTAFADEETDIVKYEVAVGTSPGGGQLSGFFEVRDVTRRHLTVSGLILKGERQIFVTVKATNGAGLSTAATSNGIYMSYLSQGGDPVSHVGVWDGNGAHGDQDFQTSLSEMRAQWDVSGDPCPVVKYEWAIRRADGRVVQDFVDMEDRTSGVNDQLSMKNKERFYQYLRVTNAMNFTYTTRSNGITIEDDPLLPGRVNDGDVIGFDLQFLRTRDKVSANWNMFGSDRGTSEETQSVRAENAVHAGVSSSNQDVAYYEVALGTDRRFPKTRDSVVPFIKVDLNKTVTFYDLELTPVTATYYFTVRAHSRSGSTAEVTSNGFHVGFDGGVAGGDINVNGYINNDTVLEVAWDGFESQIGMMMYYVGISNNTLADGFNCGQFTERGQVPDGERQDIFNIVDIRNVKKDTFIKYEDLELKQNGVYYVWVIGADKAGKCNMTSARFQVDLTPPVQGNIRTGPYYNLRSSYASSNSSLTAYWTNFSDTDSGLRCFHVSLLMKESCQEARKETVIVDSIEIDAKYSSYIFMDLELQRDTPYFVRLEAENNAGLRRAILSPPVLFDDSNPTSGLVIDGHNFKQDVSWSGTAHTVTGSFLHHPVPDTSACPARTIQLDHPDWRILESDRNCVSSNTSLTLTYREVNVHSESSKVDIKLTRDTKGEEMFSGSYYRDADLLNGGEYKLTIRAAGGGGNAVTSVMFWDGPEDYILDHDYTHQPQWMDNKCDCCVMEPIPQECGCDCEAYLEINNLVERSKRSVDGVSGKDNLTDTEKLVEQHREYEVKKLTDKEKEKLRKTGSISGKTSVGNPNLTPRKSCGLQIYAGGTPKGRVVVWCQYGNTLNQPVEIVRDLEEDLSTSFHDYKIRFFIQRAEARDSRITWCMTVHMDGELLSDECGIPHLSVDTKLYFSVWNHKNYIPEPEVDTEGHITIWSTTASFKDLVMPPEREKLCRFGDPFQGGNNAIIRYEAAIGLTPESDDVVPFRQVYSPCVPCLRPCDIYNCDPACNFTTQLIKITLNDLNLNGTTVNDNKTVPLLNYLTVKAVLGSGASAISSSDGFNIDTSPPVFDTDLMLYIDVKQGEFTPVTFQGSNDTIKGVWKCTDTDSEVVRYEWAIGLTPGSEDIQKFVSTGEGSVGMNSELGNVLENNITYFITVKCTNGAELTTTYADQKGVTVLLEPPDVDDVATNIEEAESLGDSVVPSNAMKTKDKNSVGCSWTISRDPSVKRYDFCVGSSANDMEDIFPCTWVGYNQSRTVAVKDGFLKVDGHNVYTLSQFRPGYNSTSHTDSSAFTMAPGTEMFIFVKMCNEAELCTTRLLGSTIVETEMSKIVTSQDGSAVTVELVVKESTRKTRSVPGIQIQTPDGLQSGQSLVVTTLTQTDLLTEYKSDASTVFVPYMTNPDTTTTDDDFLDRILRQRVMYQDTHVSFTVTSVGGLVIPGPLIITFPYDPFDTDTATMLLHWNPDVQKWQQSNTTCQFESETEVRNQDTSTVSVKICNTRSSTESGNSRRSASDEYFRQQTQFLITSVKSSIPNDPPSLTTTSFLVMNEDEGTLIYQMEASDINGDIVKYRMIQALDKSYDITVSEDGLMVFTPSQNFHGLVRVEVILYEEGPEEIRPAEVTNIITVNVTSVNDAPTAFAFTHRQNMLHPDVTRPVLVLTEERRVNGSNSSDTSWLFGAFDVDTDSSMVIYFTAPRNGMLTYHDTVTASPECSTEGPIPCDATILPNPKNDIQWAYKTFHYQPNLGFHGYEDIRMYIKDQTGSYSDVITFRVAVLENPCFNSGTCKAKQGLLQSCEDILRIKHFTSNYVCECVPGWYGELCDLDIDECSSDPCGSPYVCYNDVNRYYCACPESDSNCDGLQAWAIGLIVLLFVLIVIISLLAWCALLVKRGRVSWSALWNKIVCHTSGSDRRKFDSEIEWFDNPSGPVDSNESVQSHSPKFSGAVKRISFGGPDRTMTPIENNDYRFSNPCRGNANVGQSFPSSDRHDNGASSA